MLSTPLFDRVRIFAPSVYIYFASVIPALAFSEQIEHETHGAFNGVHVLVATAIGGLVQSIFGGQPLLILGVAEPIVLMYGFMYQFADAQDFTDVFVPWCTWVTIWCSIILAVFAVTGLCQYITKFTRFSGELFGLLIALLFMQQAIKGVVQEFQVDSPCQDDADDAGQVVADSGGGASDEAAAVAEVLARPGCFQYTSSERLVNGLWAVILSLGTLGTSMLVHQARSWRFFRGGVRSFLADYGVPVMVVAWSGVSYALQDATPSGIPRRLTLPNPWDQEGRNNWDAVTRLGDVSGAQIAYAIVPALIIAALFYFDHNVSAQLAQQRDFQLVRPTAYNWDMAILSVLMVGAGCLGIPPPNCVIPQAPMHTKSLVTLKKMLVQRDVKKRSTVNLMAAAESTGVEDDGGGATAGSSSPTEGGAGHGKGTTRGVVDGGDSSEGTPSGETPPTAIFEDGLEEEWIRLKDGVVPLNVKEQRLSNLIQTLLVAASIAATPLVKKIPRSVLWGYFAYMAVESLPGSEFWDRILLVFTDKRKRVQMLAKEHPAYLETVEFSTIMKFTALQFVYLMIVWGVTWAGAVGIAFPFFIIILIPGRQYIMPKFFDAWSLSQLDAAEYEEAPPAPDWVVRETAKREHVMRPPDENEQQEQLDKELVGQTAIKHHLTAQEMRRRSLQRHSWVDSEARRLSLEDGSLAPSDRPRSGSDPASDHGEGVVIQMGESRTVGSDLPTVREEGAGHRVSFVRKS